MRNLIKNGLICAFLAFGVCLPAYGQDSRLEACKGLKSDIQNWLEDEGVGSRYFYLAVCESGCKENAVSEKGAIGVFQLMPWTASHYRCTDPTDPECNTRAAARYLKHLEELSNDLETIIQMYNQGGHNRLKQGSTSESRGLSQCVLRFIEQSEKESYVVYDDAHRCAYWYYSDDSKRYNPCGDNEEFVPENAILTKY